MILLSSLQGMQSNGHGVVSESCQRPFNDVESLTKYGLLSSWRNRNVRSSSNSYLNKKYSKEPLLFSSDKSNLSAARDADAWLAPGNVVWVKSVRHGWWPAEVMDIRILKGNDSQHTARVLVQLFEYHESAWVDTSDLSQFTKCFEERNKNPSAAFQVALKQALCKHGNEILRTSQDQCTSEIQSRSQHDKSPDASKTSISSNTKNDNDEEEGRGKRKRKLKIHFDEIAVPDNRARKIRRLKIMRLLGLAAPVGSPFSLTRSS